MEKGHVKTTVEMQEDIPECAICLQPCLQPVELPCSHMFCFLCAKGTAMQSRKCALCRATIPDDFISKPSLFTKENQPIGDSHSSEPRHVWFYQGYNGWWQYDDRTCKEIEAAHANNANSVDVLVAGSVYVIDLKNKVQYQRHRNSRKRKIKRDLVTAHKKGVAGLEASNADVTQSNLQPSCSSDLNNLSCASTTQKSTCSDVSSHQVMDVFPPREVSRRMPLGSEYQLNRNLPVQNNISLQTPTLTRTSSEPIRASNDLRVSILARCSTTTPVSIETMEEDAE